MGGPSNRRVQVALKPSVLAVIEAYAVQQGVSNSKTIARLVEEGLTRRGLLEGPTYDLPPLVPPPTPTAIGEPPAEETEANPDNYTSSALLKPATPLDSPKAAETLANFAAADLPINVTQRQTVSSDDELLEDLKLLKKLKAMKKEGLL